MQQKSATLAVFSINDSVMRNRTRSCVDKTAWDVSRQHHQRKMADRDNTSWCSHK